MIPKRFAPILFALMLSGIMTCVVTSIATFNASGGFVPDFVDLWMGSWLSSWAVAFPGVLIVAPCIRRLVEHLTTQ